jgi:hypothetical protein
MSLNNIKKIILDISKNPNSTIDQVTKRTELSKSIIKRIVNSLTNDNILIEKNNYYSLSNNLSKNSVLERTDIFFNLYIPKETKDKIYSLFNSIEKIWINITGKKPSKVQMQKTFVEVNNEFNLNLPTGWYKFGEIAPISYNYNLNYRSYTVNLIEDIKTFIKMITNNTFLTPKQIKEKQYSSAETNFHKLYKLKEDFLKYISENNTDEIYNQFDNFTRLIIGHVSDKSINNFYSFLVYYHRLDEELIDYNIKNLFARIFDKFWNIIAIYNYRKSLDSYYKKNKLDINDLNTKLLLDLNIKKQEFNELLDEFYDNFKVSDFYNDPETKKLVEKVINSKK